MVGFVSEEAEFDLISGVLFVSPLQCRAALLLHPPSHLKESHYAQLILRKKSVLLYFFKARESV